MKVVLDTNVIIAAFATHGLCHLVVENVLAHHELILSEFLLTEVRKNLKIKLKLPQDRIKEITGFLTDHGTLVKDINVPGLQCRDPDDLKVLSLAVQNKADAIVTGDEDLLV